MSSALTSKGQITIPKEIREYLKIGPGDRVKFFPNVHGGVTILPEVPVTRLRGIVKWKGKPVTIREMNEAIAAGATERFRRFERQVS